MSRLMVIAVYPKGDSDPFEVYLGDCVLPGFLLGQYTTAAEADAAVKKYADHYELMGVPTVSEADIRRSRLTVIKGGKE